MDQATDPHALDPSVEAFLKKQYHERHDGRRSSTSFDVHGVPRWADAFDLGEHGGSFKLEYGHNNRHTAFMPYALARDLAEAINGVLMRHDTLAKADAMGRAWPVKDNTLPF